jgi:hypothetical protein
MHIFLTEILLTASKKDEGRKEDRKTGRKEGR